MLPTPITHALDELTRRVGSRLHPFLPAGDVDGLDEDCGRAFAGIRNLPSHRLPPPVQRVGYRVQAALFNRPRETALTVEDQVVRPGLRVRVYTPWVESGAGLVYYHGGGMVVGDLETADRWCRWIAVRSGAVVTSVHYRRAPEHPFPAGILDAIMAYNHVAAGWRAQGRDLGRLGVGGDSAGGYLATLVAQQAVEPTLGLPVSDAPGYQWLIYPGLDYTWRPSGNYPTGTVALDDAALEMFTDVWSAGGDPTDPGMSPGLAPDDTLRALPRTLVVTCEHDPLTERIEPFVDRLRALDVDVAHTHLPGLPHDFIALTGVSPASERAGEQIIDQLAELAVERAVS